MNTYRSTYFNSVLGNVDVFNDYINFSQIHVNTKKPVILRNLAGLSAAVKLPERVCLIRMPRPKNTAAYIKRMLLLAYVDSYAGLFASKFSFEFFDECWKSGVEINSFQQNKEAQNKGDGTLYERKIYFAR